MTLRAYGKPAEAEAMHRRRALASPLKAHGEGQPLTATSYDNLASSLRDQRKPVEAETMYRRALAIRLKALGEGHPGTATSYDNLASTLRDQGKSAEAEVMHRRALAIRLKAPGEGHPDTATSYDSLASSLRDQGKHAEAEAMHRRALAIRLKAPGEGHPGTATSYDNLAGSLRDQGKHAEAEAMHRRALAIRLKALGEGHPDTATSYDNLASTLSDQGKYAAAEAMHRRALAIRLKALGEGHPDTATSYDNLAWSLDRQRKYDDALRIWAAAAASYEQNRVRRARGLDAALTAANSPLPAFALALARAGRPRDAWARWEQSLSRGLADEVLGAPPGRSPPPSATRSPSCSTRPRLSTSGSAGFWPPGHSHRNKTSSSRTSTARRARSAARCSTWSSNSRASIAPSRANPPRSTPSSRPWPRGLPSSAGSIEIPSTGPACCGAKGIRSGSGYPAPARTAPGPRRRKRGCNASARSWIRRPREAMPVRWPRRWRGSGSSRSSRIWRGSAGWSSSPRPGWLAFPSRCRWRRGPTRPGTASPSPTPPRPPCSPTS